jgi:hypothetical protein
VDHSATPSRTPTFFIHSFHNCTVLQEWNLFASKHLGSKKPTNLVDLIGSTGDPAAPRGPLADSKLFAS